MTKQKHNKTEHRVIHPHLEAVGAVVLTALSFLVTFEGIIEHSGDKRSHDRDGNKTSISEIFVRGESKGEAGRLPEEFDIGLQTPHVAGL